MELKQLLGDDDAVSPVIGVILMVAITVILAAVIATFVLGLGDSVGNTAPQASFSTEFDEIDSGADGNFEITHESGETIKSNELYLRGENGSLADSSGTIDVTWDELAKGNADSAFGGGSSVYSASASGSKGSQSAVVSGNSAEFDIGTDGEIDLVYEGSNSDSSSTLAEWSGPDA